MLGTFLSLTYYFQNTLHYSALKSGFAFLPFSLGIITGATAGQPVPAPLRAPHGHGDRAVSLARSGCSCSAPWPHSTYCRSAPGELIISLGMGLAFVSLSSTALIGVDPEDAGVASALVNSTQQTGAPWAPR